MSKSTDQRNVADCLSHSEASSSSMVPYAITIKNVSHAGRYTTREQLLDILHGLGNKRVPVTVGENYTLELDSLNRLHLHGIIYIQSNNPLWIPRRQGWHIFTSKLTCSREIANWINYIQKIVFNQYEQDEILFLNDSRNINLFS